MLMDQLCKREVAAVERETRPYEWKETHVWRLLEDLWDHLQNASWRAVWSQGLDRSCSCTVSPSDVSFIIYDWIGVYKRTDRT